MSARRITILRLENGKSPFEEWMKQLKDPKLMQAVDARLTLIRDGNFGDHKSVGQGVFELRISKGPGLRVITRWMTKRWCSSWVEATRVLRSGTSNMYKRSGRNTKMKTEDYRPGLLERLKDSEYAAGYLAEVLAHESNEAFLIALRDVIEAREGNISALSEDAGITRQTLYHALSANGNPRFSTITQILGTLGLQFSVTAAREH